MLYPFFMNRLAFLSKKASSEQPITPHSNPDFNPYHHEESNALASHGNAVPKSIKSFNQGNSAPTTNQIHQIDHGNGQTSYLKSGNAGMKEAAAHQVGKMLGLANEGNSEDKLLMPTAMRQYDNGGKKMTGSAMKAAPGAVDYKHDMNSLQNYKNAPEMAVYDTIIGNNDRNIGNIVADHANQKIHGIDHSEAFDYAHNQYNPSGQIGNHLANSLPDETPIPKSIKDSLANTPNSKFHETLNKTMFHPSMNNNQDNPAFSAGPLNTRKHFDNMLNIVRKSNNFGELRKNHQELYGNK